MFKKFLSERKNILLLIFFLAVFLRLLGLINIELRGDFAFHWDVAGQIANGKSFPLLGPSASVNPIIRLSPIYYYLLSAPYLLGGGNFKIAIIFFGIVNSLAVFPLYQVSKKWFGDKGGLKAVILYAVSYYIISIQNFPWNPYLIPALIIFSLYFLEKVREKHFKFLPLLFLLLGLGFGFHATFLFIIPLFLIFIPYKKIPVKLTALSILMFLLPFSTWFYSEFISNFLQTGEIIKLFSPAKEVCNFSVWLANHGHGERCFHEIRNTLFIFRAFSESLFTTRNLFFTGISFLMASFTLLKIKTPQRKFYMTWILSVFLFFLAYSGNVYPHFFLILFPLPFFLFILFLERVGKVKKGGEVLSNVFFWAVVLINLFFYLNSLNTLRG